MNGFGPHCWAFCWLTDWRVRKNLGVCVLLWKYGIVHYKSIGWTARQNAIIGSEAWQGWEPFLLHLCRDLDSLVLSIEQWRYFTLQKGKCKNQWVYLLITKGRTMGFSGAFKANTSLPLSRQWDVWWDVDGYSSHLSCLPYLSLASEDTSVTSRNKTT